MICKFIHLYKQRIMMLRGELSLLLLPALLAPASAMLGSAGKHPSCCSAECAMARHGVLRLQELPTGGTFLESSTEFGNTFWATLDGRDEEGISPDGMVPPGEDLVEQDLKRIFSIDPDEKGIGESGISDMDEVQLMYKLRKELGEADFNRIFNDPRIKGSDIKF